MRAADPQYIACLLCVVSKDITPTLDNIIDEIEAERAS
jgi:hypothetical protein